MVSAVEEKVTLITKEGEEFQVEADIGNMSIVIRDILEDSGNDYSESIPLGQVTSKYLPQIIEYCRHYEFKKLQTTIQHPLPSNDPAEFIEDEWERNFISQFSEEELIDMIQATNFMNIPALFELCCAKVAAEYKGKDFNEIKKKYGMDDVEFTAADEEEILKQYPWIVKETEEKIAKMKLESMATK